MLKDENIHVHTLAAYSILRDYKVGELDLPNGTTGDDQPEVDLDIDSSSANDLIGYREDMIDWNKGMVLQVHKIGTEYNKWVHSPVSRSVKMFDNRFIEFFSNTPWYAIPLIWIPVTIICVVLSYMTLSATTTNTTPQLMLSVAGNFVVGLFVWTLLEYTLHRYIFHLEPNCESAIQITIHFFFHGLHHKVPFDGGRLVFPPVVAAIFAAIKWQLLGVFCGGGVQLAVFAGGIFGYICYDMTHYYIHHGTPKEGSYMYRLKRYHNAHHFVDHDNGFGISSKLWDIIFDTTLKMRKTR